MTRRLEWDVAVLDYAMPGCSGAELVREVKRQYPGRPVLVLSILPEEMHASEVFRAGGAGYINKGSANEDLTNAIRKVVVGEVCKPCLRGKARYRARRWRREAPAQPALRSRIPSDVAAGVGQAYQ